MESANVERFRRNLYAKYRDFLTDKDVLKYYKRDDCAYESLKSSTSILGSPGVFTNLTMDALIAIESELQKSKAAYDRAMEKRKVIEDTIDLTLDDEENSTIKCGSIKWRIPRKLKYLPKTSSVSVPMQSDQRLHNYNCTTTQSDSTSSTAQMLSSPKSRPPPLVAIPSAALNAPSITTVQQALTQQSTGMWNQISALSQVAIPANSIPFMLLNSEMLGQQFQQPSITNNMQNLQLYDSRNYNATSASVSGFQRGIYRGNYRGNRRGNHHDQKKKKEEAQLRFQLNLFRNRGHLSNRRNNSSGKRFFTRFPKTDNNSNTYPTSTSSNMSRQFPIQNTSVHHSSTVQLNSCSREPQKDTKDNDLCENTVTKEYSQDITENQKDQYEKLNQSTDSDMTLAFEIEDSENIIASQEISTAANNSDNIPQKELVSEISQGNVEDEKDYIDEPAHSPASDTTIPIEYENNQNSEVNEPIKIKEEYEDCNSSINSGKTDDDDQGLINSVQIKLEPMDFDQTQLTEVISIKKENIKEEQEEDSDNNSDHERSTNSEIEDAVNDEDDEQNLDSFYNEIIKMCEDEDFKNLFRKGILKLKNEQNQDSNEKIISWKEKLPQSFDQPPSPNYDQPEDLCDSESEQGEMIKTEENSLEIIPPFPPSQIAFPVKIESQDT